MRRTKKPRRNSREGHFKPARTTGSSEPRGSWPIYLGAKGYLGQGAFQGHLGAALGLYFTTVETAVTQTGEEYTRWGSSGWGLGVPLGITVSMGDTVFINAEYFLNWMWSNEAFDNDLLYTFLLGFGFNLGN